MDHALPFSQACENNRQPILDVLQRHLLTPLQLLEIGGGTGQHGEFLARHLPLVTWQSSDRPANVDSLNLRINHAHLTNLPPAIALDVQDDPWPVTTVDAVFTANTLHIMSMAAVEKFFAGIKRHLAPQGLLLVYGPFKYNGSFTTDSNARFDLWLKERDPLSGVRDFEVIDGLASRAQLRLLQDYKMPANNQLLVWERNGR
ncbi:MAG: hypothetical protein RLZZ385_1856 [Pseudomonadota bacterium]|jgi:cyclopropane fatty-acyl-phospholipid synthase-like methyltransferase